MKILESDSGTDRMRPCRTTLVSLAVVALAGCANPSVFLVRDAAAYQVSAPPMSERNIRYFGFVPNQVGSANAGTRIATMEVSWLRDGHPGGTYLVLEQACSYDAGAAGKGLLSAGPINQAYEVEPKRMDQPLAQPLHLVRIGHGRQRHGGYIMSYIGVRANGAIAPVVIETATSGRFAGEAFSAGPIIFTPADCHFIPEEFPTTAPLLDQQRAPDLAPILYIGKNPQDMLVFSTNTSAPVTQRTVVPAQAGTYEVFGLEIDILHAGAHSISYRIPSN